MQATDILAESNALLGLGLRGERLYGRRHFLDLLSSFAVPSQVQVRYGAVDLGTVDPLCMNSEAGSPAILLLAGRSWRVTSVDWPTRVAWVEPSSEQGKARWMGTSRALSYALCQAVKAVLCGLVPDVTWSKRALAYLQETQEELPELRLATTTVEHLGDGRVRWWTFAGIRANTTLAQLSGTLLRNAHATDFYLDTQGSIEWERIQDSASDDELARWAERMARPRSLNTKFVECLPPFAIQIMMISRLLDAPAAKKIATQQRGLSSGTISIRSSL